eukprot:jgi/Chlat1/8645/Chrsp87S08050
MAVAAAGERHVAALPSTVSHRPNNLAHGGGRLAYVAGGTDSCVRTVDEHQAAAAQPMTSSSYGRIPTSNVSQAKMCPITDGDNTNTFVIALTTATDIQIWDASGARMLFTHALRAAMSSNGLMRGISAVRSGDNRTHVCFGDASGSIHIVSCEKGNKFKYAASLQAHTAPVSDVSSQYQCSEGADIGHEHNFFASTDTEGNVVTWEAIKAQEFQQRDRADGSGEPVVALGVCAAASTLLALEWMGKLRVYGMGAGVLVLRAEVVAHARFATCLAVHPSKDIFATGGEDGCVTAWTLTKDASQPVGVVLSVVWTDAMVVGLAFCGDKCGKLSAAAYDRDQLTVWSLPTS